MRRKERTSLPGSIGRPVLVVKTKESRAAIASPASMARS